MHQMRECMSTCKKRRKIIRMITFKKLGRREIRMKKVKKMLGRGRMRILIKKVLKFMNRLMKYLKKNESNKSMKKYPSKLKEICLTVRMITQQNQNHSPRIKSKKLS
jgi:hypothetical protein